MIQRKNPLRGCEDAPDSIIEIVSKSTQKIHYSNKNALYADSAVRKYWIVDQTREQNTAYSHEEDAAPTIIPFNSNVKVKIFENLEICIEDLLK